MDTRGKKFVNVMKKYGPGFVAVSRTSGRVLAHGRDIKVMWEDAENKKVDFSKIVISHVPRYGSLRA